MNRANGFIVLHRKLLDWEWHDSPNTLSLFIHILLGANHEDETVNGIEIKRGQLMTSLPSLARETGQTEKQVRCSLNHLIRSGTVADRSTNKYRIITVLKYDDYQKQGRQKGRQRADNWEDKGQADGQQYNNINNENNKTNKSLTRFIAPTLTEIKNYVSEIKSSINPDHFFDYYEARGWEIKPGQPMRNWKAVVRTWERREKDGANGHSGDRGDAKAEVRSKYADISAQVPVF